MSINSVQSHLSDAIHPITFFTLLHFTSQSEHTQSLLAEKRANMEWLQASTPLDVDFLESLYGMPTASRPYARLLSNLEVALVLINDYLDLNLTLDQLVMFTQDKFESGDRDKHRSLVGQAFEAVLTYIQRGDTDRYPHDERKLSTTLWHRSQHDAVNEDHIERSINNNDPSQIHDSREKLKEHENTLAVFRDNHDMCQPDNRNFKIPLSRLRASILRKPGKVHHTSKEVVLSLNYEEWLLDCLGRGVLTANCSVTARGMNTMLVVHLGLTWEECTLRPRHLWNDPNLSPQG